MHTSYLYISAIQPIEASRGTDNKRTKTILVRNVPASADEELLEMFFEQTKKQGGGPVNSVKILRDKNIAFVEFREYGAVETVMKKRNIKFGTTELQVEPYKPLLQGSEKINRMDISGLPVAFTDGLLKAQLDSLLSPQARLSAPPTESERKSKSKTTAVEIPTAGPFCQIPDYYGDGFGNKIKVGSRVIRGRNWHAHHGDYDGRGEGTVLQLYQLGSVKVRWDNGNEARYCLSFLLPERYDVKLSKP